MCKHSNYLWLSAVLLIVLFALPACSGNKALHEENCSIPFKAKAWLAELPEGEFSIGVAYADPVFGNTASTLAKDFAAVAISRNHSSYIVDKQILLELANQSELDITRINFNVVVSADMDYLHRAAKELLLLDSFNSRGLFFALYGMGSTSPDKREITLLSDEKPAWAKKSGIYLSGDKLFSIGSAHQAELQDAFYAAQEIALRQIAQYRLQTVLGKIRSIDDRTDQALALETVTRNQACQFDRIFIEPQKIAGSFSWSVYMQLKAYK